MSEKNHYLSSLDGARALSILLVLFAHLGFEKNVPGGLGVNIFFFISGFLITRLLIEEFKKRQHINFKNFYIRRLLRLYPPLLLMIAVAFVFAFLVNQKLLPSEVLASIFYYENYFVIFHPEVKSNLGIIWSLSVEEHFYLVFPLFFSLFMRNTRWLIILTLLIVLSSLLLRVYIGYSYHFSEFSYKYNYNASLCRSDSILLGCLSSMILWLDKKNVYLKVAESLPVFIGALVVLFMSLVIRNEFFRQTLRYSAQSIALMSIIPAMLFGKRYAFINRFLSIKPLVFIGKLSYSLYLFHLIAYRICDTYFNMNPKSLPYYVLSLSGAFILALISYNLVEKPVMKLRRKFGSHTGDASKAQDTVPSLQVEQ